MRDRAGWTRMGCVLVLAGLHCLAGAWSSARAQLIDCPGFGGELAVYLDEPRIAGATVESQDLLDEIWFFLDQERERNWLESEDGTVGFQECPGRRPKLDGSDFRRDVVSQLYNQGVLLELWARMKNAAAPGDPPRWQAKLGFLSVPLRFQHFQQDPGPRGLHVAQYPRDPTQPAGEALAVFEHVGEIDLFVAVGLGIRAFRNGELEAAQEHLCQGLLLTRKRLGEAPDSDLEEVAGYVERLAEQNLAAATQTASPDSALRALLATRQSPCPEVRP